MSRIRRNQYLLELALYCVYAVIFPAVYTVVTYVLVQAGVVRIPPGTKGIGGVFLETLGGGIGFVMLGFPYFSLIRLLLLKLDGRTLTIARALLSGKILAALLDLQTRFIVARLYKGDKPLLYCNPK